MSNVGRLLEPSVVERLNQLQMTARTLAEGATTGLHQSRLKGASIEFRQHRFYVPGDEPRRLDWRVLARTDKPFIKEYDEETNLRGVILLDRSGSMGYSSGTASKCDYAVRLAAAIAFMMLAQSESVGLSVFGKSTESWLAPHGGGGQLSVVVDRLEQVVPAGSSDPSRAMHEAADRLDRRSLLMIISDLFHDVGALRQGLARLRHDRHEVIVLRTLDPHETDFPFRGWTRFRGLEGERPKLCETALVRRTYLENFNRHRAELEEACRTLHVDIAEFRTDKPMVDSLIAFLRRRFRAA